MKNIIAEVAAFYNITIDDILSPRRKHCFTKPRQIACYLARQLPSTSLTFRSYPEIGRRVGGRDHTTILHATKTIERLIASDEDLAQQIAVLRKRFILPTETLASRIPAPPHLPGNCDDGGAEAAQATTAVRAIKEPHG